ncbi:MAG: tRNA lysidine(34) synthetase TilS [Coprobacillus sp.]|nr:tRNA lysidine(34) synthetase TilS [Coprobacillus sp.]
MIGKSNLAKYLDKNKRYLLACSFGVDSMALCYSLQKEGYTFDVAYVNYNLREESPKEEESIKKYCKEHNLKIHVKEVKKNSATGNIEAFCRQIRYDFCRDLCLEFGYEGTIVAHHLEDHLETYLLQKERNAYYGFAGLKDITDYQGMKVIRPILKTTKKELIKICEDNHVPYSNDKTNESDLYERNKIRHNVIEKMSAQEIKDLTKEINNQNALIKSTLNYLAKIDITDVNELLSLDEVRFNNSIYLLLKKENLFYPISNKLCQNIKNALLSTKPNIQMSIGDDIVFEKSYGKVRFFRKKSEDDVHYIYVVDSPKTLDTPYFYLDLLKFTNVLIHPSDYPLTIRNALKDDEVEINGYKKKVSRLFIDYKMPLSIREYWPIFISSTRGIIYLPRYREGFNKEDSPYFYVKL